MVSDHRPSSVAPPGPTAPAALYLTVEQVSTIVQLSKKTIYRLVKADPTLPALVLGGSVRFPRERLLRWLRDREQGQPPSRRQVHSIAKPAPDHAVDRA